MNFADLEKAWQSPSNRPTADELSLMKQKLTDELVLRRRSMKFFLAFIFALLALITLWFGWRLMHPSPGRGFNIAREWGVIVLLALPWTGAGLLARQLLRHEREHANYERSLADSVRAAIDENRIDRLRLKAVAWLHGGLFLLLPFVIWQLRNVGKVGDEIFLPVFVGWPLLSGAILFAMFRRHRRKLLPRLRELEALQKSYEQIRG